MIHTAYEGEIDTAWIGRMHLGAQTVLKALFSDQEEGTYRRIQLSGKLLVQEELYDMILRPLYYSEGRPGFSIAHVVSRLSYFGHELIDTHFVRALILGAIPLLSLIEAFSPNAHFDCELCYFCRDLAFNSKFRVGELYLDGMFYVAPDDHVKDISSWEETSSRYSGVLLDVGHPVLFRSGDYHDFIASNVIMSWCHRIVRSKLFGCLLYNNEDIISLIDMCSSLYKTISEPSCHVKSVLWVMLLSCSLSKEDWVQRLLLSDDKLSAIICSMDIFCNECESKFSMLGFNERDCANLLKRVHKWRPEKQGLSEVREI